MDCSTRNAYVVQCVNQRHSEVANVTSVLRGTFRTTPGESCISKDDITKALHVLEQDPRWLRLEYRALQAQDSSRALVEDPKKQLECLMLWLTEREQMRARQKVADPWL